MKCQKCKKEVGHPKMSASDHGYGWECRCGWFNKKPMKKAQKPKIDQNNLNQCKKCGRKVDHPQHSNSIHGYGWECRCGWFNRKHQQKDHNNRSNRNDRDERGRGCPMCRKTNISVLSNGYWHEAGDWAPNGYYYRQDTWEHAVIICNNCGYKWKVNDNGSPVK